MSIHYHNNGTGRDSYIYSNNGGFSIENKGTIFPKPGNMEVEKRMGPSASLKFSPSNGRAIHYNQDGSGRDSYIHHNHGGFVTNTFKNPGKETFFNQLRSYGVTEMKRSGSNSSFEENSNSAKKLPDFFQVGQSIITNRNDIRAMQDLKKTQKKSIITLSKPKRKVTSENRYNPSRFSSVHKRKSVINDSQDTRSNSVIPDF